MGIQRVPSDLSGKHGGPQRISEEQMRWFRSVTDKLISKFENGRSALHSYGWCPAGCAGWAGGAASPGRSREAGDPHRWAPARGVPRPRHRNGPHPNVSRQPGESQSPTSMRQPRVQSRSAPSRLSFPLSSKPREALDIKCPRP